MPLTRQQFDEGLAGLRHRFLEMGAAVDTMLSKAVQAVVEADEAVATEVVHADDAIDQMDIDIEMECIRLIAQEAPVARDVRLIGSILKSIADMERIADYAVDVAKIGRRLMRKGVLYQPLVDLSRLTELVRMMLRDAMMAIANHDLDLVAKIIRDDDGVDELFHVQRDFLIAHIQERPTDAFLSVYLMFAGKYLERAADHATNIAERVYYAETGHLLGKVQGPTL